MKSKKDKQGLALLELSMKILFYTATLLLSITLCSQDTLKTEFSHFVHEVENYKTEQDSIAYGLPLPCDNYELVWTLVMLSNNSNTINERGDLRVLCSDKTRFEKINEETNNRENQYGTWHYTFSYLGDKYVIVTGNQATGAINQVVHYYTLIE